MNPSMVAYTEHLEHFQADEDFEPIETYSSASLVRLVQVSYPMHLLELPMMPVEYCLNHWIAVEFDVLVR